jgi:tRNA A-37 threonylcarbamoyl transferase component Bud32/tetratricopeptide (TPR) repeat protein
MIDLFRSLQTALADRYQLERELGHGGMATVYLAREIKHHRTVAIKILRPELAGILTRERFLREIRISSEFSHPHILPLLDSGTVPATDKCPALPFYTMPFVEGESLRDRLAREKQLPLDDALEIAREVAAALGYAHARGVIHRDIKPENILLSGGHAVVADFGVARAVEEAADADAITSAGLVVGTPSYMSPEQAGGEAILDGRSDLYSLGCVLYEMLGGDPPFSGPSAQAVIARHRLDPVPSLRTLRATIPESVERAVRQALEKSPADRFATAEQFGEALHARHFGETSGAGRRGRWLRGHPLLIGLFLALGAGAAWYVARGAVANERARNEAAGVDTTRYAILSFGMDTDVPAGLQPALLLRDAMARWDGMSLVDPFQVRDIVSRRDTTGFVEPQWRRLALGLNSGRYVRGSASRVGDSIRVHAVLYDASILGAGAALREQTVRLPLDLAGTDSAFAALADGLLLRNTSPGGHLPAGGTRSLPARQAYEQGFSAINDWDLVRADSSFSDAVHHDPQYAQAHLWLALVRSWSDPGASAAWQSAAERAAAGRATLSARDRQISNAILGLSRDDVATACRTWEGLTREYPHDFVVWYGLATCLYQDRKVVRDPRSPTGWRFRSSFHAALNAYQRAYDLLPSILQGLRTESYAPMVHLLLASGTDYRLGHGVPPDPATFYAFPSWAGDTLVLYPVALGSEGIVRGQGTATTAEAVRHERERLSDIARAWVAAYPASADALQALAVSLQLLGDRSALDTIARARRLAVGPAETIRVATSEIWMRVLLGAPTELGDLRAARQLTDSILGSVPADHPLEPKLLSSIAALTGRARLAARLGRQVSTRDRLGTPPSLAGVGITFLTYAAMGGPVDSLRVLEPRVSQAITTDVMADDRMQAQAMWLQLPVILAFPAYHFPSVAQLAGPSANPLMADAAFLRGDTAAAWQALSRMRSVDPSGAPATQTIDLVYAVAWLMGELGRPDSAIAFLDPTLTSLSRTPPQLFLEVYQAGALVRAMALRAELANRTGDRATARLWATAVVVLWSDADDFLQPLVKRMKELAR